MGKKCLPTINLKATGKHIVQLRKERGLSVKDMQSYFGFNAPQAIYKWQSGTTLPTVDNLLALSMLLEVPMESILVIDREPEGSVFLQKNRRSLAAKGPAGNRKRKYNRIRKNYSTIIC